MLAPFWSEWAELPRLDRSPCAWLFSGAEPAALPLAPLDYQHYVDRQLAPVADGILGFVGSSFSALTEKQIGLF